MFKLERDRLLEHAAGIVAAGPADERADRELLGGFEGHFPADLQRVGAVEAEAVARKVQELRLDLARFAMHAKVEIDIDSGVSGKPVLPLQNRIMFHVTSTSLRCGPRPLGQHTGSTFRI